MYRSLIFKSAAFCIPLSLLACQDPPLDPSEQMGTDPSVINMGGTMISGQAGSSVLPTAGEMNFPMAGQGSVGGLEAGESGGSLVEGGGTPDMGRGFMDMTLPPDMSFPVEDMMEPDPGPDPIMLPESCDGPLELPLPSCRPDPLPSTGDLYEDCVRRVNQLRAECQCLPPLERWYEGESCADEHAEYDAMTGQPHSGFRGQICSPGGRGQNECPGYRSDQQVISLCLQQMWDEGPGEPFSAHGHYINMTNPSHNRVACGFFTTDNGQVWAIQNYSP